MNFAAIDIVFLIIIVFMALKGISSGFIAEFFSKAAVILGLIAAVCFYTKLCPIVINILGADVLPEIISFLVIFIVVYLVVKLVQKIVGNAFKGDTMTGLDRALGFFLGIVEGALICAVVLVVLTGQPFFNLEKFLSGSVAYKFLSPFIAEPVKWTKNLLGA